MLQYYQQHQTGWMAVCHLSDKLVVLGLRALKLPIWSNKTRKLPVGW